MLNKIIEELKNNQSFLILPHVSPDGDTLGSATALALLLGNMNKKAVVAIESKLPQKLSFLSEYTRIYRFERYPKMPYDCVIAIDTAASSRLGKFESVFLAHPNTINIDHHYTNEAYARLNYMEERSATGEIILKLIEKMGEPITLEIANALFTAVSTDTNNFIYSNVDENTFLAAAKLTKAGAEVAKLCNRLYYSRSLGATRLIAKALTEMQLFSDNRIAFLFMDKKAVAECGAMPEECDILVNFLREINGVEIAIFVHEMKDGRFKVSLRANEYADVSVMAANHGGGGHVKAAGFVIPSGTKDEILEQVVSEAMEFLQ